MSGSFTITEGNLSTCVATDRSFTPFRTPHQDYTSTSATLRTRDGLSRPVLGIMFLGQYVGCFFGSDKVITNQTKLRIYSGPLNLVPHDTRNTRVDKAAHSHAIGTQRDDYQVLHQIQIFGPPTVFNVSAFAVIRCEKYCAAPSPYMMGRTGR